MIISELIGYAPLAILIELSTAFFSVLSIASTGLCVSCMIVIVVCTIRLSTKLRGYYNLGEQARW